MSLTKRKDTCAKTTSSVDREILGVLCMDGCTTGWLQDVSREEKSDFVPRSNICKWSLIHVQHEIARYRVYIS